MAERDGGSKGGTEDGKRGSQYGLLELQRKSSGAKRGCGMWNRDEKEGGKMEGGKEEEGGREGREGREVEQRRRTRTL